MKFLQFLPVVTKVYSRNKLFILFLIMYFAFVTYFVKGFYTIDPDFGWRLRVGGIIYGSGIPKTDPFSYTMPSFPFVDHSWIFSLLIFITYSAFKNGFMSIFLAFLTFSALYLSLLRLNKDDFEHIGDIISDNRKFNEYNDFNEDEYKSINKITSLENHSKISFIS